MSKPKLTQAEKNYILQRADDIEKSFSELNRYCMGTYKVIGTDNLPKCTEVIPLGNLQEAMGQFIISFKKATNDYIEPKQKFSDKVRKMNMKG